MVPRDPPRGRRALAGAGLALLPAGSWLVVSGRPAAAVFAVQVTEPAAGGRVTGPVTPGTTVDAGSVEEIERVEVRLRGVGEEQGARRDLEHRSGGAASG